MAKPFDLAVGEWWKVPRVGNSRLADVYPSPNPGGNQAAIMDAWNGACVDTLRKNLLVWGGGHADYSGNELYAFDLVNFVWRRKTFPSTPDADDGETYADGSPTIGHTYSCLVYLPDLDKMLVGPGRQRWDDGSSSTRAWLFDCSVESPDVAAPSAWAQQDAAPAAGNIYANLVYDPVTKLAYNQDGAGASGLQVFDPTKSPGNQWIELNTGGGSNVQSDSATCALTNPRRACFHNAISGTLVVRRLDNFLYDGTENDFGATGATAIFSAANHPGLAWDSGANKLVMWGGTLTGGTDNRDVYFLDFSTKVVTRVAGTGDIPDNPGPNGTFSRFQNLEACGEAWKGLNVLVNTTTSDVYFYRSSAQDATALPFDPFVSQRELTGAARTNSVLLAPVGIVVGYLLRLYLYIEGNVTPTPPAGFVQIASAGLDTVGAADNESFDGIVWEKWAVLADVSAVNYTITHANIWTSAYMECIRGAVAIGSVQDFPATTNAVDGETGAANYTANGGTTTQDRSAVTFAAFGFSDPAPVTAPSGTTPSFISRLNATGNNIYIANGIMVEPGATGNKTATGANQGTAGGMVAILTSVNMVGPLGNVDFRNFPIKKLGDQAAGLH